MIKLIQTAIKISNPLNRKAHLRINVASSRQITLGSDSAGYSGDGKTTVTVLNRGDSNLNLVNTYSHKGFRLHNNLFIHGSIILFPTHVFSWNVRRAKDINLDSLLLFDLIVPKVKIIVIGYGEAGEKYDETLSVKLKKKGISCEILATPNAVTTYNYLVADSVHVAGAFIPVLKEVQMTDRDVIQLGADTVNIEGEHFLVRQSFHSREDVGHEKEIAEKSFSRIMKKEKFDE